MGYFLTASGQYYEGDKASPDDKEVPQRIDFTSTWSGSAWVLSPAKMNSEIEKQIESIEMETMHRQQALFRKVVMYLILQTAAGQGITEAMLLDTSSPAYSASYSELKGIDVEIENLKDARV